MGLGQLIHLEDPNCLVLFTLICPSSPTLAGEQTIQNVNEFVSIIGNGTVLVNHLQNT